MCDKKVSNSIELLQHTGKEHSEADKVDVMDIKLQDDKKALKENNVGKRIEDGEFRCTKCEKIVSINNTLDKNIKDHTKKICKHCAILQCDQK